MSTDSDFEAGAATLRVISHPTRLKIIQLLGQPAQAPISVTQLYQALCLSQAITSQHLITLKDRGILQSHKQGTRIFYSLAKPWLMDIVKVLDKQTA